MLTVTIRSVWLKENMCVPKNISAVFLDFEHEYTRYDGLFIDIILCCLLWTCAVYNNTYHSQCMKFEPSWWTMWLSCWPHSLFIWTSVVSEVAALAWQIWFLWVYYNQNYHIFYIYPRNIQHCTLLCHLFVLSAVMYKVMWNELSFCFVSLSVLPSLATCVQTLIFDYWLDSDRSFYNIPQVKRMRETLYSSLLLQVLKYAVICIYQAS